MELLQQYIPQIGQVIAIAMLIVAILAFVVSVIVEVVKNLPGVQHIPTDIVVFVLAIVLSIIALTIITAVLAIPIQWYYYVAAVLLGFFVAFVAMFGWQKLTALWDRFKTKQ